MQEAVDNFSCFELHDIVTPIKAMELKSLLDQTGYDKEKTKFLVNGFIAGFSLGY